MQPTRRAVRDMERQAATSRFVTERKWPELIRRAGTAVMFVAGCPGGRAATSADLGILCRPAAGGARTGRAWSCPGCCFPRGPRAAWIAGSIVFRPCGYTDECRWRIPYGTLAGIVTGRVLRDTHGRTLPPTCTVPAGGSACDTQSG